MKKSWSSWPDLNPQRAANNATALPTELQEQMPVFPGCHSKLFDIPRLPELNQLRTAMRCYRLRDVPRPDWTGRVLQNLRNWRNRKLGKER